MPKKISSLYIRSIILLLCLSVQSSARDKEISFLHLDKALSQNTVTTILEDSRGFLWLGTAYGLNRYDGIQTLIHENNPVDSSSLSNNYIRKIVEDKNGFLWIATENGLNKYDRALDKFVRYYNIPGDDGSISSNNVSDVFIDSIGRLWVAADDLCLYHPETDDFKRFRPASNIQPGELVTYHNFIYQDLKGIIWYGYWNDLFKLDEENQQLELFFDGGIERLGAPGWHFHDMVQDESGYYWVATNRAGLLRFRTDIENPRPERFHDNFSSNTKFSDYRILTLFIDHNDLLWVSLENAGMVVFNKERKIIRRIYNEPDDPKSISGNSVWTIYEDKYNRMWFGIWNTGVDLTDPYSVRFTHYQSAKGLSHISNNIVTDFIEDKSGNLWIATDGGGLNYFNRKTKKFTGYMHNPSDPNSISSNAVLSLCFDDQDRLWAGTWNGGISIYDKNRDGFIKLNTENSGVASNDIFDLMYDGDGKIYIATYQGGLNIYDLRQKSLQVIRSNANSENSLTSNNLFVIYRDRNNGIWIGSLGDGLSQLLRDENGEIQFRRYQYYPNLANGISNNVIQCLYEDHSGRFWIGTSNGLNLMNRETGTFSVIQKDDGLLTNYISAISEDSAGTLWISTLKGISSFNPDSNKFSNYDLTNNLQGYNFNKNSVFRTSKGELLFGGSNGFNIFDPREITVNPFPPQIVFTDFKISNQSVPIGFDDILETHISEAKHITLSYHHSVFTIEFVALNFTHPEKNQYAYMLEGFDNNWNYSGTRRNATYTNLDAGDYTFRVKAANNNGIWNEQGISIAITISPPFWKTWWAYLLYVSTVLLILYVIMRYNFKQERLRHDLELEHLKLEKLSELDRFKSRFFSNVSHEIRTPIMLIVGPLETLLKSDKVNKSITQKVELIIRNAKRLTRMMDQLMNFYKIESPALNLNLSKSDLVEFIRNIYYSFKQYAEDHKINFKFETNVKNAFTWFDEDIIDKIVYNILSNAFKFTPDGGEVELKLNVFAGDSRNQNYAEIIIRDTGIGIPPEQKDRIFERFYQVGSEEFSGIEGIGIGLNLTHELVELHQGKISVESEKGKGTVFHIILPADIVEFGKTDNVKKLPRPDDIQVEDYEQDVSQFEPLSDNSALILFVEDDPDVLQYIKDIFSDRFQILTAANGKEGFEKAIDAVPDLIISDIMMPEMDGYELCQKLKSEEKTSHIPIILLTAHSEAEQKLKGLKLGAIAYLPKPFNTEELIARVNNLLMTNIKLREKFRHQIISEPENLKVLSIDEKFMMRVKQEVEDNISDLKMDAEFLSEKIGISRIQLYRKLKGLTGQTVHEFIRTIRLQRAKQLLNQQKMKITEIAYHVGFSDLNYFTRCFKKQFGKSPSEYLAKNTGEVPRPE